MKIEKISDNRIRCTLNKDDLQDRELKISELAYGTEKAKALFRDMMQQASFEFGFEADDIPLMIEAIPVSSECLILDITKVEDPDELDTRFSKFSMSKSDDSNNDTDTDAYADEILNCFDQIDKLIDTSDDSTNSTTDDNTSDTDKNNNENPVSTVANLTKVYSFRSLDEISTLAHVLVGYYHGENTLYKDSLKRIYYLVINKSIHTPEEFNKICNIISEYGRPEQSTYATVNYFDEHLDLIIRDKAVQVLYDL